MNVIYKYHNELEHIGRDKMMDAIFKTLWFKNMKVKCSSHIDNCLICVAFPQKQAIKKVS